MLASITNQSEHFIAGLSGGFFSTLVVHPLDLLKVRVAVNEGDARIRPQHSGYFQMAKSIINTHGIRGLYQGATPNIIGNTMAWGFYFFFYNQAKDLIKLQENRSNLSPQYHLLSGFFAGGLTLILTNPIWVAKTRLCLQYENQQKAYKGMTDCLVKLYKEQGLRGLYKGFIPGLIGTSHGAVQFMVYEEMKSEYCKYKSVPTDQQLSSPLYLTFGATSKIIAAAATYPYQVVRARLQDQHKSYSGVWDVVRKTSKHEGIAGFYKGLLPSLLRVTPATAVTFVVYENVRHFVQSYKKKNRT